MISFGSCGLVGIDSLHHTRLDPHPKSYINDLPFSLHIMLIAPSIMILLIINGLFYIEFETDNKIAYLPPERITYE